MLNIHSNKLKSLYYHIDNMFFYYRAGSKFSIILKHIYSLIEYKLNTKKNLIRIKQLKKELFEQYNIKVKKEHRFVNAALLFWLNIFEKEKLSK